MRGGLAIRAFVARTAEENVPTTGSTGENWMIWMLIFSQIHGGKIYVDLKSDNSQIFTIRSFIRLCLNYKNVVNS